MTDKVDVLHTIGGDDTNTAAADLAAFLARNNYPLTVVCVGVRLCVCMCVYICMYVRLCVCMCVCVHMYVDTYTPPHTHKHTQVGMPKTIDNDVIPICCLHRKLLFTQETIIYR